MERNLYKNPEILKAYIGTPSKFNWYEKVFDSYDVNGVEKFSFNWSWWGFFFAPAYLAYRKCYLMAVLTWCLIGFLQEFFLIPMFIYYVILGFTTPFLIFKKYKKTVKEIETKESDFSIQVEMARELGGVNIFVRNLFIFLCILHPLVILWLIISNLTL